MIKVMQLLADLETKIRGGKVLTSDEVKFLRNSSRYRLRCDLYTTPVAFTQGVWRDCLPSRFPASNVNGEGIRTKVSEGLCKKENC